jgi:hypothetical protein
MSTEPTEVKIGDVGTVYDVPIYDNDLDLTNFDPSEADAVLRFRMKGVSQIIERDADAVQKTINGVSVWCLRYVVVAADVAPYESPTVGGFHQEAGPIAIEPYLEFSSDQKWTGSTVTTDQQGRPLRVVPRLSI